ncbi:hypothetical protein OsccyDRAFT_2441 [Leptolyngbyaceae cyanobacterium JSC-12]|nr:hypothetical protein OsccyDRAFT_2441 [Leptolyngbyaceae cyanobacterium JSC-12]
MMNSALFGLGLSLALVGITPVTTWAQANHTPQTIAQEGSQAAKTHILDLGVNTAQLQQMKALRMKMVMPRNVPPGFKFAGFTTRTDQRFGPSYLMVYRKGSVCFGIEGTSGGIGSVPPGNSTHMVKNAVLGRGAIEQQASDPQLIGQWMGRGPFYRFVGANYTFNGGAELAGCQNVTAKEAVFVSEALRYLDLETDVLLPTPVAGANSPTSTVVKYPDHKELNEFRSKLKSGAFGNGVKLSAADRNQRQSYQATWAKVNPTGAKFAGAWVAGDRYYYVYPSKVKSRVCVVTLNNGKYEFSNGQSIRRELRYQSHGLFWIDRADVLAARDSGTGQLYPIFATQSAPNPAELANFDFGFRHAECTTELP